MAPLSSRLMLPYGAAGAASASQSTSGGLVCVDACADAGGTGDAVSFGGDAFGALAGRAGRRCMGTGGGARLMGGMYLLAGGNAGISCSQTRLSCSSPLCTGRVAAQNSARCSTTIAAMVRPWGRRPREKACFCSARSLRICSTLAVMKVIPVCKFTTAL